ncbi:MAG: hypothetical protein SPD91_08445 [Streptococcus hyointestinalis]|uniref:hypothetical protein n=1 Tax=Streptococcus hyointestinalis TaxID=1337 RepID=UPI0023F3B0A2|nr:hypothetical protein [Streptococcus hyointestinalis]MCI6870996.1 hypothetical protein [Streptococcus hyointestinalis]MDD7357026.1 hypothetical protein [Streptococcus hyointestinalis]MDY4554482.1 hypothetical protein [Streptococcus hyointestinalis]
MKSYVKRLFALSCVLLLTVVLVACSKGLDGTYQSKLKTFVGEVSYKLTINGNKGKMVTTGLGQTKTGTVTIKESKKQFIMDNKTYSYKLDGDKLTLKLVNATERSGFKTLTGSEESVFNRK